MKLRIILSLFLLMGMTFLNGQQSISKVYKDQLIAQLQSKIDSLKLFVKQAHDGSTLGDHSTLWDAQLAQYERQLAAIEALPVETPTPNPPQYPTQDPLTQFIALMKTDMLDGSIIVSYSQKKNNLELTMGNEWLVLPYETRLRSAQDLAVYWNRFQPGGDIALYDQNGNQVGGDGDAGIWVKK